MTEQPPSDVNSGIGSKWGEFCDEVKSKSFVEEKWSETHNPNDDYWERKSEKVTSFYEDDVMSIVDIGNQDSKKFLPGLKSGSLTNITVDDISPLD